MEKIANKYNIIRKLGSGATGDVYLVEHEDLKTQYALKLLSEEVSSNHEFVERFICEAQILEQFSNKGTARLMDFGKNSDGRYYMTTDFCKGITLSHYIEQYAPIKYPTALKIIVDILDVLKDAHKEGIIHRDIKSDNIIINYDEKTNNYTELKILDFGIAKIKQNIALKDTRTVNGFAFGTPQYMAPEQAAGEKNIDHRIDLYSTGIILYELLSKKAPFCGETIMQTLLMHLTKPMPPFDENLNIPKEITSIVNTALQKVPNNRYQTAEDFITDCLAILNNEENIIHDSKENDVYVIPKVPQEQTTILCIDDDEMILNIMNHILSKEGYDVYTTSDPSILHSYLFQKQIDLLISDVNMPKLRGPDICKMLKQTMPDLKIALFSNVPEQELDNLAKDAQANAWISKNSKPTDWLAKIAKILKTN